MVGFSYCAGATGLTGAGCAAATWGDSKTYAVMTPFSVPGGSTLSDVPVLGAAQLAPPVGAAEPLGAIAQSVQPGTSMARVIFSTDRKKFSML
jgi:hypothetical protein